jgi:hypothetical protein
MSRENGRDLVVNAHGTGPRNVYGQSPTLVLPFVAGVELRFDIDIMQSGQQRRVTVISEIIQQNARQIRQIRGEIRVHDGSRHAASLACEIHSRTYQS